MSSAQTVPRDTSVAIFVFNITAASSAGANQIRLGGRHPRDKVCRSNDKMQDDALAKRSWVEDRTFL